MLAVSAATQVDLAGVLVQRTADRRDALDHLTATAIATAAWAALQAALSRSAERAFADFAAQVDDAMAYLRPAGLGRVVTTGSQPRRTRR